MLIGCAEKPSPEYRERFLGGLKNIDSSATRMTRLINDLMDIVRLRVGQPLELQRERTDLVTIVRDVIDELGSPPDISIQFVSDVPSLPGSWDPARLERVVGNLLTNATKYGRTGGSVRIRLGREYSDGVGWAILT